MTRSVLASTVHVASASRTQNVTMPETERQLIARLKREAEAEAEASKQKALESARAAAAPPATAAAAAAAAPLPVNAKKAKTAKKKKKTEASTTGRKTASATTARDAAVSDISASNATPVTAADSSSGKTEKQKTKKRPALSNQSKSTSKSKKKKSRSKSPKSSANTPKSKDPAAPKIVEIIRPEPELDPEIALDAPRMEKAKGAKGSGGKLSPVTQVQGTVTVHWNPDSVEGKRVGYAIRIFDQEEEEWRDGRVIRFDPVSNKHKIQYNDSDEPCWLRLKHEIIQCGGDFVWALVKGFAWWPAQIFHCEPSSEVTSKDGFVYVRFFGADQVALVKDSSDYIRPFNNGTVDSFMAKNKKKRNPKAIQEAKAEYEETIRVRNAAVRFYACKAFAFANNQATQYLGKRVQFYNSFINYPAGDTVTGIVKHYSPSSKKWLILYDPATLVKHKIEAAGWFNFVQKECQHKILEKIKGAKDPTDDDLAPYMFGLAVSGDRAKKCTACSKELSGSLTEITCSKCQQTFHSGCCDPPLSLKAVENILNDKDPWICSKCIPCSGCNDFDIVFGTKRCPAPPTLFRTSGKGSASIQLCSRCVPLYECNQFCADCGHVWDDIKYQKVQRVLRWEKKQRQDAKAAETRKKKPKKRKRGAPIESDEEPESNDDATSPPGALLNDQDDTESPGDAAASTAADPSWHHPDSTVFGYNEGAMLICDSCNLWVHAGCAGLNKEEYDQANRGDHPIYSKEFLCRRCCKERCRNLIMTMNKEDKLGLFAVPVTEAMAPNYHDVIKNPMDLQTMMAHANEAEYHNYAWIRERFELMVTNALIFNRPTSTFWREAKRFYDACTSKIFTEKGKGKAAPPGKHADALRDAFEKAKQWRKAEKERVQKDETAEKKDLVAGSAGVAAVKLSPLITPDDIPSCIPFVPLQLKPVDGYFCSWMECCLCCGSSGAADTMLFCVDCGEAYHSFCANAPIFSMSESAAANWRCPNCKVCEITGDVPQDETMLLYCEMCDRACTLTELDPPLEKVPSGLFICGLCVDCKTCQKKLEQTKNVKNWSQDPVQCYRCGGCRVQANDRNGNGMICSVCSKFWRSGDKDVATCKTCKRSAHSKCDRLAKEALEKGVDGSYECTECSLGTESRKRAGSLQFHLNNQARNILLEGCALVPNPEKQAPTKGVYAKLSNETEWAVRDMWRSEYKSVVNDAERALRVASKKFGAGLESLFVASDENPEVPTWLNQRARRWVRCQRQRESTKRAIDTSDIRSLVLQAQMASAFLAIYLGCVPNYVIDHPERMQMLLVPSHTMTGFVNLPPDPLKTSSRKIIRPNELESSHFSSNLQSENDGDSNDDEGGDVQIEISADASTIELHQAVPLQGWNDIHHYIPGRPMWRDPRRCVFCNTCGDDDAGLGNAPKVPSQNGLTITDAAGNATSSNTGASALDHSQLDDKKSTAKIQPINGEPQRPEEALEKIFAGRLIPMGGGAWAHTSCALWSSEVYESPKDGLLYALEKARSRGSKLKCFGCGRPGATVGCTKSNCPYNFHFVCAHASGAVFTEKQQVLCKNHKSNAPDLEPNLCVEHMRPFKIASDIASTKPTADDDGNLCYRLGSLVIHSFGNIEQEIGGFHSEQYITPPGYTATRIFWSFHAPRRRTVYVLKVDRERNGPVFSIIAADATEMPIRRRSMFDSYDELMNRMKKQTVFSQQNQLSDLPRERAKENKAYGLNAPQFFGFGIDQIRRVLEGLPGIAAVAAPLASDSPVYKFCFSHPKKDYIKNLMRKRAAAAAERALENPSGSARTEGMTAVDKSGGSGRITRALVRRADEEGPSTATSGKGRDLNEAKIETAIQEKYREMRSVPLEDRLVAKRSHIHGWGLFTKKAIRKHQMIIEYMGELLRFRVADKRERSYEESGVGSCYMFRLDLERIVDATMVGCMARFMNHSCQNNAYAKVITVTTESLVQEKKIIVFANRDIKADEEITYDYKFPVEDGSLKCTCGAPNCIGRMN